MTSDPTPSSAGRPSIGFEGHDHDGCIAATLAVADEACASRRLRLTSARRRVLEILLEEHRALGAYEILARLGEEGLGSQPPAAYRALDFLVRNGFAHRIERLNAYVACALPSSSHSPVFLICRACSAVAETPAAAAQEALGRAARATGFRIEHAVVEAEGLCPACDGAAAA